MMENNQIIIESSKAKKIKSRIIKIICILFMATILLLTYLPLIVIFLVSFSSDTSGLDMINFTFKWYQKIFEGGEITDSIIYTLQITIASTIIATIFGTISAIGINAMSKKTRKKMIVLNNVPILNADIVTAVFLLIIFQIISITISSTIFGFTTTLIAHVLFSAPYVVLSVLPKLNEIDDNLYDAAIDLGCSPKSALWKIVIPSIKSGIFSGAMLAFTMSIDDFIITHFVTGDKNNFSTWLFSSLKVLKTGSWNKACAYNSLITIITLVSVLTYQIIKTRKKKERNL